MRVFVTGSKGFVGSNLTRFLRERDYEVVTDDGAEIPTDKVPEVEAVFHNAAITKTFDVSKEEMYEANLRYPERLFKALAEKGCRRFIVASSTAVYGNGPIPFQEKNKDQKYPYLNFYSESKLALETSCYLMFSKDEFHQGSITQKIPSASYCCLRYCNVYGPGESHKGNMASMIRQIALQILNDQRPKLFQWGEQVRDYIHVEDVCFANLCALNSKYQGVVNCGGGFGINFEDLTSMISRMLGKFLVPEFIPNPHGSNYQKNTLCDMTLAKEVLGFVPKISLEEGVKTYLNNIYEEFKIQQLDKA